MPRVRGNAAAKQMAESALPVAEKDDTKAPQPEVEKVPEEVTERQLKKGAAEKRKKAKETVAEKSKGAR